MQRTGVEGVVERLLSEGAARIDEIWTAPLALAAARGGDMPTEDIAAALGVEMLEVVSVGQDGVARVMSYPAWPEVRDRLSAAGLPTQGITTVVPLTPEAQSELVRAAREAGLLAC